MWAFYFYQLIRIHANKDVSRPANQALCNLLAMFTIRGKFQACYALIVRMVPIHEINCKIITAYF